MDITLVDVTEVTSAAPGDAVVLFGRTPGSDEEGGGRDATYADTLAAAVEAVADEGIPEGGRDRKAGKQEASSEPSRQFSPPTVEEVAAWAETIPHEILSRVAPRVPRRYLDSTDSGGTSR